jgi:dTDP-glucose pyrophosphorylase
MNAVVRALGIGTRIMPVTARVSLPLPPAGRPVLPAGRFEMIPASKVRTRWRAP